MGLSGSLLVRRVFASFVNCGRVRGSDDPEAVGEEGGKRSEENGRGGDCCVTGPAGEAGLGEKVAGDHEDTDGRQQVAAEGYPGPAEMKDHDRDGEDRHRGWGSPPNERQQGQEEYPDSQIEQDDEMPWVAAEH